MTTPGPPPQPNDRIQQEIQRLWEAIREMNRKTLYSASISGGALTVQDGAEFSVNHELGEWLLHVGIGTQGKYFLTIRRNDGTAAFEIGTNATGEQFWALWDRAGHVITADDATSGQGLARPWLSQPTIDVLSTSIPASMNSTWIATQSSGQVIKQQPYAEMEALVRSEGGGVGQARFTINDVPVGTVMDIAADAFEWKPIQTVPLPGGYDSRVRVEVQVQRTNTVGTVGAAFRWSQRQT